MSKLSDGPELFGIRVGAHGPEPDRSFQYRCCLVFVDKTQFVTFDVSAFGFEIGHLTGDQFLTSRRDCDLTQ